MPSTKSDESTSSNCPFIPPPAIGCSNLAADFSFFFLSIDLGLPAPEEPSGLNSSTLNRFLLTCLILTSVSTSFASAYSTNRELILSVFSLLIVAFLLCRLYCAKICRAVLSGSGRSSAYHSLSPLTLAEYSDILRGRVSSSFPRPKP